MSNVGHGMTTSHNVMLIETLLIAEIHITDVDN